MALIAIGLFVTLRLVARPEKLSDERRQKLQQESERLGADAWRLNEEWKLKEAVRTGQQMLMVDRRLLGNEHEDIAFDLEWLPEGQMSRLETY